MTAATSEFQRPKSAVLAEYDSDQYGPLFAVSDEGSAGPVVLDAALSSAKAAAGASSSIGPSGPLRPASRLSSTTERFCSAAD